MEVRLAVRLKADSDGCHRNLFSVGGQGLSHIQGVRHTPYVYRPGGCVTRMIDA